MNHRISEAVTHNLRANMLPGPRYKFEYLDRFEISHHVLHHPGPGPHSTVDGPGLLCQSSGSFKHVFIFILYYYVLHTFYNI
jgi:hypothetical protein